MWDVGNAVTKWKQRQHTIRFGGDSDVVIEVMLVELEQVLDVKWQGRFEFGGVFWTIF